MAMEKELMPLLIAVLSFFTIFLLVFWIYYYGRQRAKNREMIEKIRTGGDLQRPQRPSRAFKAKVASVLVSLGQHMKPEKLPDQHIRFLKAGLRGRNVPAIFWGVKCFLMLVLSVSFLVMRLAAFKLLSPSVTLSICVLLALVGFYTPDLWLRIRMARRREQIFRHLPDALDLLVVCVEAGLGLDAAINRVADEMRLNARELSDELRSLNLELRAGKLRRDALTDFARRIDLEEVRNLVTLLIQTDKFGTSIANALRVYSDSLRTKRFQRAEEMAVKLPTKLIFPMILFIFPSLFVAILGPAAIRILRVLMK